MKLSAVDVSFASLLFSVQLTVGRKVVEETRRGWEGEREGGAMEGKKGDQSSSQPKEKWATLGD